MSHVLDLVLGLLTLSPWVALMMGLYLVVLIFRRSDARLALKGLGFRPQGDGTFTNTIDGVRITAHMERGLLNGDVVVLRGPTLAPSCPKLRSVDPLNDIAIGDHDFDETVHVRAVSAEVAVAYLDDEARNACHTALRLGATLNGAWIARVYIDRVGNLLAVANAIACASTALTLPESASVRTRLCSTAQHDRQTGVRVRAIELLAANGGVPASLAEQLSATPTPEVRYAVGKLGGAIGRRALFGLLTTGSRCWRIRAAIDLAQEQRDVHEDLIEQVLIDALDDDELADAAATALIPIASPRVLPAIAARPGNSPAYRRVRSALRAQYHTHACSVSLVEELREGAVSLV
jgi:hypothetical protein